MNAALATKEETKKNGGLIREELPRFGSLQQEINRLFDEFGQGFGFLRPTKWLEPLADFHAKVDVKETDKEIVVTAELPGVDMKDIDVSINSNGLVIKGEKREEKEEKEKGYYKMERSYGSFHRVLPLPAEVDRDHITATHKDGVVKITLPKTEQVLKDEKKISLKAG
jgi:HSP20 family protein